VLCSGYELALTELQGHLGIVEEMEATDQEQRCLPNLLSESLDRGQFERVIDEVLHASHEAVEATKVSNNAGIHSK
jgi:hypothetical protein